MGPAPGGRGDGRPGRARGGRRSELTPGRPGWRKSRPRELAPGRSWPGSRASMHPRSGRVTFAGAAPGLLI
jgi:hypothetical protein